MQETEGIWSGDLLNREADALFLLDFLRGRLGERAAQGKPQSYVLNLDAKWGTGKSFFLERFGKMVAREGHVVATVNAWRDDHADDPLLSVMSALDTALKEVGKKSSAAASHWKAVQRVGAKVALAAAKGAAIHWASKIVGSEGVGDVINAAMAEGSEKLADIADERATAMLDDFTEAQRSIVAFRDGIAAVLKQLSDDGVPLPVFVLIDELDRCRPSYAIAMLERVKHLFDLDGVAFIIATDTGQLQHAVGAVYGTGFDSQRYLHRFFDRTYSFEEPRLTDFVLAMMQEYPLDPERISLLPGQDLPSFLGDLAKIFDLSLRDVAQCYDIVRTVATAWPERGPLQLSVLLPMAIAQHAKITPHLSGQFVDRLRQYAEQLRSPIVNKQWNFVAHDRDGRRRPQAATLWEILQELNGAGSNTYQQVLNKDDSSGLASWVRDQAMAEVNARFPGGFSTTIGPLWRDYAAAVRTAGRLVGGDEGT